MPLNIQKTDEDEFRSMGSGKYSVLNQFLYRNLLKRVGLINIVISLESLMLSIRLAKKSLHFLSKTKRHIFLFIFTKIFIEKHTHFVLLPFAIFQATSQFHLPKTFIFLNKELFQVPFTVFHGIEFFHQENFVKIKINGNLKVQCLLNREDKSALPRQAVTGFAWSLKKQAVLCYPDGRLRVSC